MPKKTIIYAEELNNLLIKKFPLDNSLIPLSIILKTIRFHFEDRELSLKLLYSELNSSEIGARIHIQKLANTNWLQIEKSILDKRVRLIKPSSKMLVTFESMSDEIRHKMLINIKNLPKKNYRSLIFSIKCKPF